MRWQTAIFAGAFALVGCETNEAPELVEVTAADLAGSYEMLSIGGVAPADLDSEYCIDSSMTMTAGGDFEIRHHFTERIASGACSTAADRFEYDLYWRGDFEVEPLLIMTILETELAWLGGAEITPERTEMVAEFNPATGRLVAVLPDIWGFDPHGGAGGKISTGGGARGIGGGALVFAR